MNLALSVARRARAPGSYPKPTVVSNLRDAAYFMTQATPGPKWSEIQAALAAGDRATWLEDQFTRGFAKRMVDKVYEDAGLGANWGNGNRRITYNALYDSLVNDNCPLRWRCLRALMRIFVCSVPGGGFVTAGSYAHAGWVDRLNANVFGNYVDLLESVTYSYPMSVMLSYYANSKETATQQPDENYAREIMQLFTIGLWKLNTDGSRVLVNGQPVPTYTNEDIRQMARVFTGLTQPTRAASFYTTASPANDANALVLWGGPNATGEYPTTYADPMYRLKHYVGFYETGAKTALEGLVNVPANTDGPTNLRMVHEALVNHPSCAPFVCQRLIQATVTSTPSPGYIARVAERFRNNGQGVTGDMKSVWRAIFLDPEAAQPGSTNTQKGRVKDGFEYGISSYRSFERKLSTGYSGFGADQDGFYGMEWLQDPSIFGYYDLTAQNMQGKQAVEALMWTPPRLMTAPSRNGQMADMAEPRDTATTSAATSTYDMIPLSGTADELADRLNYLLCGGYMSPALRADLLAMISPMSIATVADRNNRATAAINLVTVSLDHRVQL